MTSLFLYPGMALSPSEGPSGAPAGPAPGSLNVRHCVTRCIEALIDHGTDVYGPERSPLLMAVIDVGARRSPEKPDLCDSLVRLEERLHRRAERGSNLWYDQATLRVMRRLSELTGNPRYANAADAYIDYFWKRCKKEADPSKTYLTGMPAWGSHVYWNCYEDRPDGDLDGAGPHEILVYPEAVRRAIDGIWKWHVVDKETGMHNRHDDARRGLDFAFSGGTFIHAFAFMFHATGEKHYLDKAKTVANWHWRNRNKETGLVADSPASTDRYDGQHCFTTVAGPHAASLLRSFEITGEAFFRDVAVAYIKAYDRHGWDEKAETYFAMLRLDGTPIPERPKGEGYDAWAPYGHVDVWPTCIFAYEFPLIAAQAAIYAYELSEDGEGRRDADLLRIAQRWGRAIEKQLPPQTGRRWKRELEDAMPAARETGGTYAENYGRAISFLVHLYRATQDEKRLRLARDLAREAIEKLFENDLFKGHPAKPYYEATNGVGLLLWALLELDAPDEPLRGAF